MTTYANFDKGWCVVCECNVVLSGHAERCRIPVERLPGWDKERKAAWYGDTVQRMDVQLALRFMDVDVKELEATAQSYCSNAAMAEYMRKEGFETSRSAHTLATWFESRYSGSFRECYLRETFPTVYHLVLAAWVPPLLFYS